VRPLDPRHDAYDDDADVPGDAPVSAVTDTRSFWDHLGATRAEEYATEDILPHPPAPVAPSDPLPHADEVFPLTDMPHTAYGSLNDVLEAHDHDLTGALDGGAPQNSVSPYALSAGQAMGHDDIPAAPVAPFAAVAPEGRKRRAGTSRMRYRLQRIWLTPMYRGAIKLGTPVAAIALVLGLYFSDADRSAAFADGVEAIHTAFVERPEFMVTTLELPQTAPELEPALREKLEAVLPQSTFRLDLDDLRRKVEELDWVRTADLRLKSDGVLSVTLTERVPAILWRSGAGLELLDAEGVRVALVAHRGVRADLPLIAGQGADTHVAEALELMDAAAPLGERLRGLVRMGERRWDVVLDRDQRIRLPESGAVSALERVIALDQAQDLLARDLITADLRDPARPVLQISEGAMDTLRAIRSQSRE